MATVDPSKLYIISTTITGQRVVLASSEKNNTVLVEPESSEAKQFQQWEVSLSEFLGLYRLSTTQQTRNGRSLDIFDDNGTESRASWFSPTGYYTGQFWRLEPSVNGTYRLSNNFTGPDKYLDGFSEALLPQLSRSDSPSQYWTFTDVTTETLITTTQTPDVPFTEPSASSAAGGASDPYALAPEPGGKLSAAGIAGVAIGGGVILALALGVGFVVFISFRRTRNKKKVPKRPAPPFRERSYTAKWHDNELPLPRYEPTLGNEISEDTVAELPHHHDPNHIPHE